MMRRSLLILTFALTAAPVAPQQVQVAPRPTVAPAYSLYSVADGESHVLKKHDIVNIVVREELQPNLTATIDNFVKFNQVSLRLDGLAGQQVRLPGNGGRADPATTRLDAEVIGVNVSGTLILQARHEMKIDGARVRVTLTGACHVRDVDETNSVLSTDVHDLKLGQTTIGEARDPTRRGQLDQILEFGNPV